MLAKGKNDVKVCETCHNFEKGAGVKIGPPLWGVVGRKVASVAGFDYSSSLKAVGGDWTYRVAEQVDHRSESGGRQYQDGLRR